MFACFFCYERIGFLIVGVLFAFIGLVCIRLSLSSDVYLSQKASVILCNVICILEEREENIAQHFDNLSYYILQGEQNVMHVGPFFSRQFCTLFIPNALCGQEVCSHVGHL